MRAGFSAGLVPELLSINGGMFGCTIETRPFYWVFWFASEGRNPSLQLQQLLKLVALLQNEMKILECHSRKLNIGLLLELWWWCSFFCKDPVQNDGSTFKFYVKGTVLFNIHRMGKCLINISLYYHTKMRDFLVSLFFFYYLASIFDFLFDN